MYYYYLLIGTLPLGHPGHVMGYQFSLEELTEEYVGQNCFVKIPTGALLLGYRYLEPQVPGITVLGEDFFSKFEAPPALGCRWDGKEWVTPEAAAPEV
jgi:hypothetical protein